MEEVLERLARLEERVKELGERMEKLERAIYGNSNPASMLQRIAKMEERVRQVSKINMTILGILISNLVGMLFIILHMLK